jgi:anti-sigma-K factor RskA
MTEDRWLELAPIHALGALDGEDRVGFEAHLPGCSACSAELRAHEAVVACIPLALPPVRPTLGLRQRVIERQDSTSAPVIGAVAPRRPWATYLAAAAALLLGLGLLVVRWQRDSARVAAAEASAEAKRLEAELSVTQRDLAEAAAFRALVQRPGSLVTTLAGLAPAPKARARVVFDPVTREAILVASGLDPAPEGKAYEAWVIAGGAPVPVGTFRPDAQGGAVVRLPRVEATGSARTFAVTLEPEAGTPAPTGPMVLAGAVS